MVSKEYFDPRRFKVLDGRNFNNSMHSALRYKNWKLVTGKHASHHETGFEGVANLPLWENDWIDFGPKNLTKLVVLYDLEKDEAERHDLSNENPEIVNIMLEKLADYHVS